jgi:hypothetical protein
MLPMSNVIGVPWLEVVEADLEQTEFEEDVLSTIVAAINVDLLFSKSRPMNLDYQTACIAPISPPPKHK